MKKIETILKKRENLEEELVNQVMEDLINLTEENIMLAYFNSDNYNDMNYFNTLHLALEKECLKEMTLKDLNDEPSVVKEFQDVTILKEYNKLFYNEEQLMETLVKKWKLVEGKLNRIVLKKS